VDALGPLRPVLIVDAMVGYGLTGPPRGEALAAMEWAAAQSAPIVSLDVPSGLDATTGHAPGASMDAAMTMTLALPKTGLDAAGVGELWLADIGIPRATFAEAGIETPRSVFRGRHLVRLNGPLGPESQEAL
jgi:NAD(P)H-hydrate epimerase